MLGTEKLGQTTYPSIPCFYQEDHNSHNHAMRLVAGACSSLRVLRAPPQDVRCSCPAFAKAETLRAPRPVYICFTRQLRLYTR